MQKEGSRCAGQGRKRPRPPGGAGGKGDANGEAGGRYPFGFWECTLAKSCRSSSERFSAWDSRYFWLPQTRSATAPRQANTTQGVDDEDPSVAARKVPIQSPP